MSLYDDVLNCPDTHCRKKALDKLCKEKIVEGMERAAVIIDEAVLYWNTNTAFASRIRQVAKDLEDA